MAFDESKDVVLDSRVAVETDKTRITVQICQYNGGAKKLGIKRDNRSRGEWTFAKLGRLEPREWNELAPVAFELLEKHGLGQS